jgi:uncharacterized protein YodC (DUF2158 family)
MKEEIKVGDVVVLASGGPRMVVRSIYEDGKMVECQWFSKAEECMVKSFGILGLVLHESVEARM